MSNLPQVANPAQVGAPIIVNQNFAASEHQVVYGKDELASSGLIWGYLGGRWGGFSITADTVTLTGSTTNYIVVEISTGDLSVSTSSTHWNDAVHYVRVYKVVTGSAGVTGDPEDHRGGPGGVHGGGGAGAGSVPKILQVAASDETTALTTGGKVTVRAPYAMTLSAVRASLTRAQATSSIFTVDVKLNGTSIFSTLLTIDNTEKTSVTAATPAVLSTTAIADDDEITVFVTQVGTSTAAAGLKVTLIGS